MATVEGQFDKRENRFLADWGREQGISSERMQALFRDATQGRLRDEPLTGYDLELLACMALADGVATKKEWQFLQKIGKAMGRSSDDLNRLLRAVADGSIGRQYAMSAPA